MNIIVVSPSESSSRASSSRTSSSGSHNSSHRGMFTHGNGSIRSEHRHWLHSADEEPAYVNDPRLAVRPDDDDDDAPQFIPPPPPGMLGNPMHPPTMPNPHQPVIPNNPTFPTPHPNAAYPPRNPVYPHQHPVYPHTFPTPNQNPVYPHTFPTPNQNPVFPPGFPTPNHPNAAYPPVFPAPHAYPSFPNPNPVYPNRPVMFTPGGHNTFIPPDSPVIPGVNQGMIPPSPTPSEEDYRPRRMPTPGVRVQMPAPGMQMRGQPVMPHGPVYPRADSRASVIPPVYPPNSNSPVMPAPHPGMSAPAHGPAYFHGGIRGQDAPYYVPHMFHRYLTHYPHPNPGDTSGRPHVPSLQWDIVYMPLPTARFFPGPEGNLQQEPREMMRFDSHAYSPHSSRRVEFTSDSEVLRYWMAPTRWGPIVVGGEGSQVPVLSVLDAIYNYFHQPLTVTEIDLIFSVQLNRERLADARRWRLTELHLARRAGDYARPGYFPLDPNEIQYLRSDVMGGHRRFAGCRHIMRDGVLMSSVEFIPGPIPQSIWLGNMPNL